MERSLAKSGRLGFTFSSDSSQHDRIREFNTNVSERLLATKQDHDHLNCTSYVVLSYEIGQLSSCAETCDIPAIGYIQNTNLLSGYIQH